MRNKECLIPLALLGAALITASCGEKHAPRKSRPAQAASEGPIATILTTRAELGLVEETVETFGTVEFDTHDMRTVSFLKAGQVLQVLVVPGQPVAKGDPLLRLGALPSSSMEVERARIELAYHTGTLERLKRLQSLHLATNEALEMARKDVATARAVLEGLGVDTSNAPRTIAAPFSGIVVKVLATTGALVGPREHALLLAPADGLAIRAGFEPEDAIRLLPGMAVRVSPVFRAEADSHVVAVLTQLHRVVDLRTQLVETLIQPKRIPEWMMAGTKVMVSVLVRSAPEAIRVPRTAMIARAGVAGVFGVKDGVAHWTPVQVGLENSDWVEIRSGIEAGTVIVTTGRTSLADGMRIAGTAGRE